MNRYVLLFVAALALSMAVGSGGFSTVSADRGMNVAVVEDENAYLQVIEEEDKLVVRDRFAVDLEIDVEDSDEDISVEHEGDETTITCTANVDSKPITISGTGDGVSVELTREVPCEPPENDEDRCENGEWHIRGEKLDEVSPITDNVDCDVTVDGGGDNPLVLNATIAGDLRLNGDIPLENGTDAKVTGNVTRNGGTSGNQG